MYQTLRFTVDKNWKQLIKKLALSVTVVLREDGLVTFCFLVRGEDVIFIFPVSRIQLCFRNIKEKKRYRPVILWKSQAGWEKQ